MFSLNNINATMGNMVVTKSRMIKNSPITHKTLSSFNFNTSKIISSVKDTPLRDISNIQQSSKIKDTPSSIHLSEFIQPPRSTSTPNQDLFLEKKSADYSTSLFMFNSRILEDKDMNSSLLHDTNESLVSSSVLTNSHTSQDNSPLAPHNRDRRQRLLNQSPLRIVKRKEEIHSNSLISDGQVILDESMKDYNHGINEGKIIKDSKIIDSNDVLADTDQVRSQVTPIFVFQTPNETIVKKRVRINDDVEFIDSFGVSSIERKRPPSSTSSKRSNTPKKKKLKHYVDPEANYDALLKLCGKDRDPLALIKF